MFAILAPHIDDETIGCWSYLNAGQVRSVLYFYDITAERTYEAIEASKRFGFDFFFVADDDIERIQKLVGDDVLLVPSAHDNHKDHKAVSALSYRLSNDKLFYSIDMNTGPNVLAVADSTKKKADLTKLYPSQSALFADEKYHLFEKIVDIDFNLYEVYETVWNKINIRVEASIDGLGIYVNDALSDIGCHPSVHVIAKWLHNKLKAYGMSDFTIHATSSKTSVMVKAP